MSLYTFLTELDRKVILFTYENRSKSRAVLPCDPFNEESRAYILTEGEYILWEMEKRVLTEKEVLAHSWLVSCKDKLSLLLSFESGNQLKVSSLFDEECYKGHWLIDHGILKVYFNYQDHDYDISIIANNNRPVHSALQIIDDSSVDILKVVPVSHAKYGSALIES